jgi:hypothetical protein
MRVKPSNAGRHQPMAFDQHEDLFVFRHWGRGKRLQELNGRRSRAQLPADKLTDNERMAQGLVTLQQLGK